MNSVKNMDFRVPSWNPEIRTIPPKLNELLAGFGVGYGLVD